MRRLALGRSRLSAPPWRPGTSAVGDERATEVRRPVVVDVCDVPQGGYHRSIRPGPRRRPLDEGATRRGVTRFRVEPQRVLALPPTVDPGGGGRGEDSKERIFAHRLELANEDRFGCDGEPHVPLDPQREAHAVLVHFSKGKASPFA